MCYNRSWRLGRGDAPDTANLEALNSVNILRLDLAARSLQQDKARTRSHERTFCVFISITPCRSKSGLTGQLAICCRFQLGPGIFLKKKGRSPARRETNSRRLHLGVIGKLLQHNNIKRCLRPNCLMMSQLSTFFCFFFCKASIPTQNQTSLFKDRKQPRASSTTGVVSLLFSSLPFFLRRVSARPACRASGTIDDEIFAGRSFPPDRPLAHH